MGKKKDQHSSFITRGRMDITMIFVVMFLMVFGIIMIYSSSYYYALEKFQNPSHFVVRQSIWVLIGTIIMLVTSKINFRFIMKFVGAYYLGTLMLLVLVLFMAPVNNSRRWISLGPLGQLQPSEVTKVVLILVLAWFLAGFKDHLGKFRVYMLLLVIIGIPVVLVGLENLSTAIVLVGIVGGILFVIYPSIIKLVLLASVPVVGGFYWLLNYADYRGGRIAVWLDGPFSDPTGVGYQTIQSLYAIGSGGFFGVGLGKSIQKIDFIPEAHNDIIFSIICEELGMFGAFSIIMLFVILLWRMVEVVKGSKNVEGMLLTVGVLMHIGIQVFINIGVVTNAIPATGIPLPLISYGGSSLIFLMFEIGLVLNVSRHNDIDMRLRALKDQVD